MHVSVRERGSARARAHAAKRGRGGSLGVRWDSTAQCAPDTARARRAKDTEPPGPPAAPADTAAAPPEARGRATTKSVCKACPAIATPGNKHEDVPRICARGVAVLVSAVPPRGCHPECLGARPRAKTPGKVHLCFLSKHSSQLFWSTIIAFAVEERPRVSVLPAARHCAQVHRSSSSMHAGENFLPRFFWRAWPCGKMPSAARQQDSQTPRRRLGRRPECARRRAHP